MYLNFLIFLMTLTTYMCPVLSLLMTSKLRDLKTEETIFFSRYLILGIKVLFNELFKQSDDIPHIFGCVSIKQFLKDLTFVLVS